MNIKLAFIYEFNGFHKISILFLLKVITKYKMYDNNNNNNRMLKMPNVVLMFLWVTTLGLSTTELYI